MAPAARARASGFKQAPRALQIDERKDGRRGRQEGAERKLNDVGLGREGKEGEGERFGAKVELEARAWRGTGVEGRGRPQGGRDAA